MPEVNLFKSARDTISLVPGEALFREGEAGDAMYAVIEGALELTRNGEVLDVVGPGNVVGELAMIDDAPRSATAVARTESRVARIDRAAFTYLVQDHPTFALQVMAVMADRLRVANARAQR